MLVVEYLQADRDAYLMAAAILGLMVGSFLNVVIYRLPEMMRRAWESECNSLLEESDSTTPAEKFNLWVPRSTCPACNHAIGVIENVPVISYLWLRGQCSSCKGRFPYGIQGWKVCPVP